MNNADYSQAESSLNCYLGCLASKVCRCITIDEQPNQSKKGRADLLLLTYKGCCSCKVLHMRRSFQFSVFTAVALQHGPGIAGTYTEALHATNESVSACWLTGLG